MGLIIGNKKLRSIGLIEREEKEDSVEEEIMDFLNMPGWSLIPWKNL